MRLAAPLSAALLGASFLSTPAAAQERVPVERRVDTLEKQMRSVQRHVFKPGEAAAIETPVPVAPVANGALTDLASRVDALERSLQQITAQVEENANRVRTLEEEARRARADADARLDRLEGGTASPGASATRGPIPQPGETAEVSEPAASATGDTPATTPASVTVDPPSADPAENAYLAGFRLWEAKRYDEAETVLKEMVTRYPKHKRASWARNLLGRTYLDTGKPATAAEVFLSNYQDIPRGDRAADSLFYLGDALMRLKKPEQACKVYDELSDAYGSTMRDALKQNLPSARKAAKCHG